MSKIVLLEYYGPYFSRTFLSDMIVNWFCNKILSGKVTNIRDLFWMGKFGKCLARIIVDTLSKYTLVH